MDNDTPRVFAVGDIHGCYDTLMAAIKAIGIRPEDTLIACGDIVDRGPKIRETLDYLLNRKNTEIAWGNHDISFVEYALDEGRTRWSFMKKQGLNTTLRQLGADAEKYASLLKDKCVDYVMYDEPDGKKYVMCHSMWPWHEGEEFNVEHTWARWFSPEEKPEETFKDYDGPIIVHGHTPVGAGNKYEEYVNGKLIGINLDGGCNYGPGGCLRVMCLTNGKVYEHPPVD